MEGREWKSPFLKPENGCEEAKGSNVNGETAVAVAPSLEDQIFEMVSLKNSPSKPNMITTLVDSGEQAKYPSAPQTGKVSAAMDACSTLEISENDNADTFHESEFPTL